MENIIFITLAAVICGCKTWNEIEEFGNDRIEWFDEHIDMSSGVPSHDTLNRFFSLMDTEKFEECFRSWASSILPNQPESLHIDGKTIKGSRSSSGAALHMVSAWSSEAGISLGQVRTAEKSNEITAIPELLEALFIKGSVITIDAMGCQKEIVKSIVENEGDYIIAVKRNQKGLFKAIDKSFLEYQPSISRTLNEHGHGRKETRSAYIITDLSLIENSSEWGGLKSIVALYSTRETKTTGEAQEACQYFITSLSDNDPEKIMRIIRNHWSIENNLHWQLDVSFDEDGTKKRNATANQNFSLINKIALHALTQDTSVKMGVKSKRLKAGWNTKFLEKVMGV